MIPRDPRTWAILTVPQSIRPDDESAARAALWSYLDAHENDFYRLRTGCTDADSLPVEYAREHGVPLECVPGPRGCSWRESLEGSGRLIYLVPACDYPRSRQWQCIAEILEG